MTEAQKKLRFIGGLFLTMGVFALYASIFVQAPNIIVLRSIFFASGLLMIGAGIGFLMLRNWAFKLMAGTYTLMATGIVISHFFFEAIPTDIAMIVSVLFFMFILVTVLFYRKFSSELT
jgi:hypothetical protein